MTNSADQPQEPARAKNTDELLGNQDTTRLSADEALGGNFVEIPGLEETITEDRFPIANSDADTELADAFLSKLFETQPTDHILPAAHSFDGFSGRGGWESGIEGTKGWARIIPHDVARITFTGSYGTRDQSVRLGFPADLLPLQQDISRVVGSLYNGSISNDEIVPPAPGENIPAFNRDITQAPGNDSWESSNRVSIISLFDKPGDSLCIGKPDSAIVSEQKKTQAANREAEVENFTDALITGSANSLDAYKVSEYLAAQRG